MIAAVVEVKAPYLPYSQQCVPHNELATGLQQHLSLPELRLPCQQCALHATQCFPVLSPGESSHIAAEGDR